MLTNAEFTAGFAVLEGIYGKGDEGRSSLYFQILGSEFNAASWMATCIRWVRTEKKFPQPSELLENVPGKMSKDEKAIQAWEHVWDQKDCTGPYNPHREPEPHGRNVEPKALKAIGGIDGLVRLFRQQDHPREVEFMKRTFLTEYKRLEAEDERGSLFLDAPSTKAFNKRGGVKSLGDALDCMDGKVLLDAPKKCEKHGLVLVNGLCPWCEQIRQDEEKKLGLEDPRR